MLLVLEERISGEFIGSRMFWSKYIDLMSKEEEGESLVVTFPPAVGTEAGGESGVETYFFSEVMASCGMKVVKE